MKGLGNKDIMAKNLKRLMREKGVSAKAMSKTLDFPYTTLLSWLKAENYPRIDKIEAMAAYFGVMKSDLIEDKAAQETETPAEIDGLTDVQRELIEFARSLSADDAAFALQFLRSALEAMQQRRSTDQGSN